MQSFHGAFTGVELTAIAVAVAAVFALISGTLKTVFHLYIDVKGIKVSSTKSLQQSSELRAIREYPSNSSYQNAEAHPSAATTDTNANGH